MIVKIDEDVVADITERTDAETPAEIAAQLEDCWSAIKNAPTVVERHRRQEVAVEQ